MELKELVTIRGGKRLPKGKMLVSYQTNHPYIKVKDMIPGIIQINDRFEYVTDNVFSFIKHYTVDFGDIILSIVGTIGNVSMIGRSLDKASLTENCVKLISNGEIHPSYLLYFLLSEKGQQQIHNGIVGTTQPKLPIYNIEKIEINLPDIKEQQHIVDTRRPPLCF